MKQQRQQKQFSSQIASVALFIVVVFGASAMLFADAQMTFSDGWGAKRSAPAAGQQQQQQQQVPAAIKQQALKQQQQLQNRLLAAAAEYGVPYAEECHARYQKGVFRLQQEMNELREQYQRCHDDAVLLSVMQK